MMKRKIVSALLVLSMAFSLSGCTLGSKYTEKKAAKFYKEELEGEEMDVDDFLEGLDNGSARKYEDGAWTYLDKKQTKNAYSSIGMNMYFASVKKAESSVAYLYSKDAKSGHKATFVMTLTFDDKKDIDEFFEESMEVWEDMKDIYNDYKIGEGENKMLFWGEDGGNDFYLAAYRNGKNVLLFICVNNDSTVSHICDYFELVTPVDMPA